MNQETSKFKTSTECDATPYQFDEKNEKDLASIYRQIAVMPEGDFDEKNQLDCLINMLEESFSDIRDFKRLDIGELLSDKNKVNLYFVTYIKYCLSKDDRRVHLQFVVFCDYFAMNYSTVFMLLSDKLSMLVVSCYRKMIGANEYRKLQRRLKPEESNNLTLFGMVRRENKEK